jgi:hypothetical protein
LTTNWLDSLDGSLTELGAPAGAAVIEPPVRKRRTTHKGLHPSEFLVIPPHVDGSVDLECPVCDWVCSGGLLLGVAFEYAWGHIAHPRQPSIFTGDEHSAKADPEFDPDGSVAVRAGSFMTCDFGPQTKLTLLFCPYRACPWDAEFRTLGGAWRIVTEHLIEDH